MNDSFLYNMVKTWFKEHLNQKIPLNLAVTRFLELKEKSILYMNRH